MCIRDSFADLNAIADVDADALAQPQKARQARNAIVRHRNLDDDASATLKPFDARCDAAIGARAYRTDNLSLSPDKTWKGRVVDALGRPLDGAGELVSGDKSVPLDADPPPALSRGRVHAPIRTGVRVVDLFTPLCLGQRVGVFAGSGVGKSSLLAMLARSPQFDSVVIALVFRN